MIAGWERVVSAGVVGIGFASVATVAACGASSSAPPTASAPAAMSSASAASSAPALPAGPFTRGAPYAFTARTDKPKLTAFPIEMIPRFASDGRTAAVANSKRARLITDSTKLGPVLSGTHAYRSAFSPNLKLVATTDEDTGDLSLFEVPSGKLLRRVSKLFPCATCAVAADALPDAQRYFGDREYEIAFSDDMTLVFHDGAQLRRLDLSNPNSQAVPLGPPTRGRPHPPERGDTWIVAEPGVMSHIDKVVAIDGKSGAARVVLDSAVTGQMTEVSPSPANDRVCFQHLAPDAFACATTVDGHLDMLEPGSRFSIWIEFSDDGNNVVFFSEPVAAATSVTLEIADLGARTIRPLAVVPRHDGTLVNADFVSPTRVYLNHGGSELVDLSAGWSMEVLPPTAESRGAVSVPGNSKRLVIGKAAGGREAVSWADLPE